MLKLRCIIIAAVIAFFSLPPTAHAVTAITTDFTFNGSCSDCGASGGSGTASGTLVLTGYALGTTLQTDNFVSFTYTSVLLGTLTANSAEFSHFGSTSELNAPFPAAENIAITWVIGEDDYEFHTSTDGTWALEILSLPGDVGTNAIWSTTPIPAALPLFATGLSALGLFGWRRKRKAAALAA
jgi:hypothetical protein